MPYQDLFQTCHARDCVFKQAGGAAPAPALPHFSSFEASQAIYHATKDWTCLTKHAHPVQTCHARIVFLNGAVPTPPGPPPLSRPNPRFVMSFEAV